MDDLLGRFAAPLIALGLPYMITGGAAAFDAADTYVPPVEVLEVEAGRRLHGHFNVIHAPTSLRADVYIAGEDPLSRA